MRSRVPATVPAEESRAARLLVVGDRGASRLEGVLAGSVAVALLCRSACPVVVVRGPERNPAQEAGRPVVVGLDVTPASLTALDVALAAAASRGGGELVAVHTTPHLAAGPAADLLVAPAAARAVLDEVEQRVGAEYVSSRATRLGVPVRTVTGRGRAGDALLAEAARGRDRDPSCRRGPGSAQREPQVPRHGGMRPCPDDGPATQDRIGGTRRVRRRTT